MAMLSRRHQPKYTASPSGTADCMIDPIAAVRIWLIGRMYMMRWPSSWKPRSASDTSGTRCERTNAK